MKVLIVSDTHGRDENLEHVVMNEAPFDMFVHCGDVEGREIFIEALVECPCCIVSGNNDFFSDLPREEEIELDGNKVLVTHGHYYGVSMDISGVAEELRPETVRLSFSDTRTNLLSRKLMVSLPLIPEVCHIRGSMAEDRAMLY